MNNEIMQDWIHAKIIELGQNGNGKEAINGGLTHWRDQVLDSVAHLVRYILDCQVTCNNRPWTTHLG